MEYDRALYRVYERVMEDLSTSPDILPAQSTRQSSATSTISPVGSPIRVAGSRGSGANETVSSPNRTGHTSIQGHASNGTTSHHHFIPFFVPMRCTPYVSAFLNRESNVTSTWGGMFPALRHQNNVNSVNTTNTNIPTNNDADADVGQTNISEERGWTFGRFRLFQRNGYSSIFSYGDRQEEVRQDGDDVPSDGVELSNLPQNTNRMTDNNAPTTSFNNERESSSTSSPLRTSQQREIPSTPTSPSTLSSDGLRQRRVLGSQSPTSPRRAISFDAIETFHNTETNSSISSNESGGDNELEENFVNSTRRTEIGNQTVNVQGNHNNSHETSQNESHQQREQDQQQSSTPSISQFAQRVAMAQSRQQSTNTTSSTRNTSSQSNHRNQQDQDDDENVSCTKNGLYWVMRLAMIGGFFHLVVLYLLHSTYVNPPKSTSRIITGTISREFTSSRELSGHHNIASRGVQSSSLNGDEIDLQTCIEYALSTRPIEERSRFASFYIDRDGNYNRNENIKSGEISNLLLGDDEILQIKILHGGSRCESEQCSRTWKIGEGKRNDDVKRSLKQNPLNHQQDDEVLASLSRQLDFLHEESLDKESAVHNHTDAVFKLSPRKFLRKRREAATSINSDTEDVARKALLQETPAEPGYIYDEVYSSADFWSQPDYRFSTNDALTYLDDNMLRHLDPDIRLINVTLSERCLSSGSDSGPYTFAESLAQIYSAYDTVIINALMYGIRSADGRSFRSGYLKNMDTSERFSWSRGLLRHREDLKGWNIMGKLLNKLAIVLLTLVSFFLITSVTALIVRILTSSGVILLYPMFALIRLCGVDGADDRLLEYSYPWIGRARRAIRRARLHPQNHFLSAHLAKLFLYYIMYEACQIAWISLLYNKSMPASITLYLFSFAMIIEYFSMVFVRSALSAYFFPRITLLYFTCFHIYFYSIPYGFFDTALIPWFCFMVHAMLFCVIALEVPASVRGSVSLECPREVYTKLSWPEWEASFPHEWTIFLPLNSRYIPLHDRQHEEETNEGVADGNLPADTNATNPNDTANRSHGNSEDLNEVV